MGRGTEVMIGGGAAFCSGVTGAAGGAYISVGAAYISGGG
jgi:hypothetical protein